MHFPRSIKSVFTNVENRMPQNDRRKLSRSIRLGLPASAAAVAVLATATFFGLTSWAQTVSPKRVRSTASATQAGGWRNQAPQVSKENPRSTVRPVVAAERTSGNPTEVSVVPAAAPTALDNDFTRINNAVYMIAPGGTITLTGTFDWTEANAAASWALGSDGIISTADDYSIYPLAGLNNVTFTASSSGAATIQGPGDLAVFDLESVFYFDGGPNLGWTISNIRFLDFDNAIGFYYGSFGANAFNGTTISNNLVRNAADLNATVAPSDSSANIAIHLGPGNNQTIAGNTIELPGDGVSDSANNKFATNSALQSNSNGTNTYDFLQILNNTVNVQNAQSADPELIYGIWENGAAPASTILVSGNTFNNLSAGNNPALNRQLGFRVTSHSSATSTVTYFNNVVSGANIGMQWYPGTDYSAHQPVIMTSNTVTGNQTGVLVQSQGLANLSFNRIVGNAVGVNNVDGTVTAKNNWWGCNGGPGSVGCSSVVGTVDYAPWMVLGISASPASIGVGETSTVTADMTHNSDGLVPSTTEFLPEMPVTFSATEGTMSPANNIIVGGMATSVFTSTSANNGSASATVDDQTVTTPITVTSPTFAIDDVTLNEGDAGTTSFVFTVTKTGTTGLSTDVTFATQDGTATIANSDYQENSGTLTFLAGDTTKQVTVLVNGDTTQESDETFFVNLTATTVGTITDSQGTGTILNDDAAPVYMSISDAKVFEGDQGQSNLTFTVTLSSPAAAAQLLPEVSAHYHTTDGTAKASDKDYVPVTDGIVTFNPAPVAGGSPTATISILVNGDLRKESNEFLYVTLDQPQGATISRARGAGIIIDEDRAYVGDVDRDRKTDLTVFRPSDANWYTIKSSDGNPVYLKFGISTDEPVAGDYDGDGVMDYAVRRPGKINQWYYQYSSDLSLNSADFGIDTDVSVQADYDGDGKTDVAVYRDGQWYVRQSSDLLVTQVSFGLAGDIPVAGDFDGDAKADFTVFRAGVWYTQRSSDSAVVAQPWGQAGDVPVAGDFDGDGRFDQAVFRNGDWYVLESLSNEARTQNWGLAGDIPVAGDYDGDGTSDVAVFRPSDGDWHILRSSDNTVMSTHWGQNGDVPIPSTY